MCIFREQKCERIALVLKYALRTCPHAALVDSQFIYVWIRRECSGCINIRVLIGNLELFVLYVQILAAHSRRRALRLLQWDNELFLAASLLFQSTSLVSNDASIAERLYGLRRASVMPAGEVSAASRLTLTSWQRALSVLFVVRLARSRLNSVCSSELGLPITPHDHNDDYISHLFQIPCHCDKRASALACST
jgi:hypothetical protein